MLHRKPRRGETIFYQEPGKEKVEYIVMGKFGNHNEILNITTPEHWNKNKGSEYHTQVIWTFKEGPNPWLSFQ